MKRINVKINNVIIWSAYKSNGEYQAWIDSCIQSGVWGEVGSYAIEVLDATAEIETRRQTQQLSTKQEANAIDSRVVDLENSGVLTHVGQVDNPHSTTKLQVGLGNVDDVSAINLRDRSTHTGNETQLTWSEGISPSVPASGLTTYAKDIGGRQMLAQLGSSGVDYSYQPFLARNKIALFQANGNATTSTVIGAVAPTASGTATTRNVATTNFFTWIKRVGYVSATTGNASSGIRTAVAQYGMGLVNRGGFHFVARFGISDAVLVPGARLFVGMIAGTGVIGNSDPSSLTNIIGVGMDAADTTLQILHNDAAGNATKINLGASFPESTNADLYELALYCAPGTTTMEYRVKNLSTDAATAGQITTNIPAVNQLLAWQIWRHNVSTGLAVGIDVSSVYIETDN